MKKQSGHGRPNGEKLVCFIFFNLNHIMNPKAEMINNK